MSLTALPDKETTVTLLEILNTWVEEGEVINSDIEKLSNLDSDSISEQALINQFNMSNNVAQQMWHFLRSLETYAIGTVNQRLAQLIIRLKSLIGFCLDDTRSKIILDSSFAELLLISLHTPTIKYSEELEMFAIGKDFQFKFSVNELPTNYQRRVEKRYQAHSSPLIQFISQNTNTDPEYFSVSESLTVFLQMLEACEAGKDNSLFEDIGTAALSMIFEGALSLIDTQISTMDRTLRRDAIFRNLHPPGFWEFIYSHYKAGYIIVDFKNYKEGLTKEAVNQIEEYTNEALGSFGIVWTRGPITASAYKAQRSRLSKNKIVVLIIHDNDVVKMFEKLAKGEDPADILQSKLDEFATNYHD